MAYKSKYVKDASDIKAMTDKELRDYIRGGSKVLKSRVSRLAKSPYAQYSPTLAKYANYTKDNRVFANGFGTKGLEYGQLRRMANYLNTMLATEDTVSKLAQFGTSIDRIDDMFQARKFFGAEDAWKDLIHNHFDAVKEYVSKNVDTWIAYVGSDGVDDVFNVNEYDNDEDKYLDLLRTIIVAYRKEDIMVAGRRIAAERLDQGITTNKTAQPIKQFKYRGKFKK